MDFFCPYCTPEGWQAEKMCDPTNPNICKTCQKVLEIEAKMTEARLYLFDLANQHLMLKQQIYIAHDRVTQQLPVEITTYIFELCMPVFDTFSDLRDFDHVDSSRCEAVAPLVLSAVCKQWRAIALSTPRLWNILSIYVDKFPVYFSELVEEWIARARNLPLSVSVYVDDVTENDPGLQAAAMKLIHTLCKSSDRWRNLVCAAPQYMLDFLLQYELPHLRGFGVELIGVTSPDSSPYKLRPQRLCELSMHMTEPPMLNFDWTYLTKLRMESFQASLCFEALLRAPSLVECVFEVFWNSDFGDIIIPQRYTHSKLEHLEIEQADRVGDLYAGILAYLVCPSLKTLILKSTRLVEIDMALVVQSIRTSNCNLENLSVIHIKLSALDIETLCEGIPTLQVLHIDLDVLPSFTEPAIGKLIARLAVFTAVNGIPEPRYLPALRSLTVKAEAFGNPNAWKWWWLLPYTLHPFTRSFSLSQRHRHALESLNISISSSDPWDNKLYDTIHRMTIEKILSIRDEGVNWKLTFRPVRVRNTVERDILKTACDYFGIPQPII